MSTNPESTFQKCPHDRENPYSMVSLALIRDETISPGCRWLIMYLLSNKEGWVIKTSQIISHLKGHPYYGEKMVRKLINEAIKAGYMKREKYLENNLTRYRYFVSENPKFSKNVSDTAYCAVSACAAAGEATVKYNHSSPNGEDKKDQYKKVPPSEEAVSLYNFFLMKIKERTEDFKEPNKIKWCEELDKLLRIDKRNLEKTKKLLEWASTHKWWKKSCLSPTSLREKYDQIAIDMASNEEESLIRRNRAKALNYKEKYPDKLKVLSFDDKYVMNRSLGKEIPLNLPEESFDCAFVSLFGGQYE